MRLYRGMTKEGKWIESYSILRRQDWDEQDGWNTRYYLQDGYSYNETPKIENFIEVISKTVGQFVGLKDENGKKIYEGDILQDKTDTLDIRVVGQPRWYDCDAFTEYGYYNLGSFQRERTGEETSEFIKNCKIIDNIYNNPEFEKYYE